MSGSEKGVLFVGLAILLLLWSVFFASVGMDQGYRQGQLDASNGKWCWHLKDNEWQRVDPPATRPRD